MNLKFIVHDLGTHDNPFIRDVSFMQGTWCHLMLVYGTHVLFSRVVYEQEHYQVGPFEFKIESILVPSSTINISTCNNLLIVKQPGNKDE